MHNPGNKYLSQQKADQVHIFLHCGVYIRPQFFMWEIFKIGIPILRFRVKQSILAPHSPSSQMVQDHWKTHIC